MQIVLTVKGSYPRVLPEDLARALEAEVAAHLKGYGLTDIEVRLSRDEPLEYTGI
jgi:hypothetical protein